MFVAFFGCSRVVRRNFSRRVRRGRSPVSVAVEIAQAEDANVQRVLHEAYERKVLRGHSLMVTRPQLWSGA